MNRQILQGRWQRLAGRLREQWGWLTDDDDAVLAGRRQQAAGLARERCGIAREATETSMRELERRLQRRG